MANNVSRVIPEQFILSNNTPGISGQDVNVSTGQPLMRLFEYEVLVGESFVFRASDTFSMYLFSPYVSLANGTGTVTEAGTNIGTTAGLTLHITGAGNFTITLPRGVTGTLTSGTATITSSPVTLAAGANLVTSGATTGTATLVITETEAGAGTKFQLVITDSTKQNDRCVINPTIYTQAKEFQNVELLCHLDVAGSNPVVASEGEWIRILVNGLTYDIGYLQSYFKLSCLHVRKTMF